jgi:hypothetical protein
MFKNYFKIALRNLWRDKTYTLINIMGLAVGIAAMVWAFQDYRFSFSWDNFQPDRDNVYRALTFKEGADQVKGVFPMPVVAAAKNDFPGIQAVVRYDSRGLNVKAVQSEAFTEQVYFTDPAFLAKLPKSPQEDPQSAIDLVAQIAHNHGLTWKNLLFLRKQTKLPILL